VNGSKKALWGEAVNLIFMSISLQTGIVVRTNHTGN
jgi:hypothetical protein